MVLLCVASSKILIRRICKKLPSQLISPRPFHAFCSYSLMTLYDRRLSSRLWHLSQVFCDAMAVAVSIAVAAAAGCGDFYS